MSHHRPPPPGVDATGLSVRWLTEQRDLEWLAVAWNQLLDENRPGAPFRSPAWLIPWWQYFRGSSRLRICTVWRGSTLVGVLPAYRVKKPLGGWQLRLLGDRGVDSDYLGLIAHVGMEVEIADAVANSLVRSDPDLVFDGLDASDVLIGALRRSAARVGATCRCICLARCPYVSVEAAGDYADWLLARPTRVASRLAATQRWLDKQPGTRLVVLADPSAIVQAAPEFWRIHHARWASEGGSDAVYDAETDAFHFAAFRALAERGWARLYLLYVNSRACAGLFGLAYGRQFAYYQGGFDPDVHRTRSLGMTVLNAALHDAFAHGVVDFDFLRGEEPYKALYASSTRELARIEVASGALARVDLARRQTVAASRGALRRGVPVSLVRRMRRVARSFRRWQPRSN